MKTAYVDTSALIAVYFGEPEGASVRGKLTSQDELLSSALLEAEFLSALSREKRSLAEAVPVLSNVSLVFPDGSLRAECEEVLQLGHVRGADLWHLATALAVAGGSSRGDLLFVSLDQIQRKLARKIGFRTWPA